MYNKEKTKISHWKFKGTPLEFDFYDQSEINIEFLLLSYAASQVKRLFPWDPGEHDHLVKITAMILVGTAGQVISELISSKVITQMARCSTENKIPQSDASLLPLSVDCLYPLVNICTRSVRSNLKASSPVQTYNDMKVQTKGIYAAVVLPWDTGVQSIVCTNFTTCATASYLPGKHTPAHNMNMVQVLQKERIMGLYKDTEEMIPISLRDLLSITFSYQDCIAHEDLFHLKQRVFPKFPSDQISMETLTVIMVVATSTSFEPARQESKFIVVSAQELKNIVVIVQGPYYTNSNPTGCGLFWETNSSCSTLRQSVSYIWVYKRFDPRDPPLALLFNMAMQSGECYATVKQRKCQKLKHLEIICWTSPIWIISFMPP